MCMMLYVAADKPLTPIAWDEKHPAFNVTAIDEALKDVRRQFSKAHIYYLGAHTGCSCGFRYGDETGDGEREEREAVLSLSHYLSEAAVFAGPLELYSCWSGDEAKPPLLQAVMKLEDIPHEIGGTTFGFEEREFINIIA